MSHNCLLVLAALAVAACSTPEPYVDIAEPKVYTEDDTLRFLSERRRELDKLATTISAAELQEARGVRERTSTQVELSLGRESGDVIAPGDPPTTAQTLPAAPTSTVGLTYSELLQRQITRAQEFAAYDLLYLGDQTIQDQSHRVFLVRLDVSVNASLHCGSHPKFVVVQLEVESPCRQPRIYALMPEFSAATAKETWISSVLSDYSGSLAYPIGSFDANARGRLQKELEESFERLVQQPLQFAIYQSQPGTCKFAIGPRRRLERRSWINPARWFGSTYRVDYEIAPGPRACLALITVEASQDDESNQDVELTVRRSIVTAKGVEEIGPRSVPARARLFSQDTLNELYSEETAPPKPKPAPEIEPTKVTLPARLLEKANDLTFPPKTGGSLLVLTMHPVGNATRAYLGEVAVPLANTHVLGARRLQLDIAKSDALEARRVALTKEHGADRAKVKLRLVTPGQAVEPFEVLLLEGPSSGATSEPKPVWVAMPTTGVGPLHVQLQPADSANSGFLAQITGVEALLAEGRKPLTWQIDAATKSVVVQLPDAGKNRRAFVDFWITRSTGGKTVVDLVRKAFRYDL